MIDDPMTRLDEQTPHSFEVMEARGVYLRENRTRRLTADMLTKYEIVVSMAEEPFIAGFLAAAPNVIRWTVPNPKVVGKVVAEEALAQIGDLVKRLFAIP